MLNGKRVLAVIQARGGSKGIPKKNIYEINGHPLISYTICAALKSKYIDQLVVSTDSEEIADVAKAYGASVPFMRPDDLAGDKVASVDSLLHAVEESEKYFHESFDVIVELPCVAPLRAARDIDGALEKLISTGANSVISVVNTGEKHPVRLKRILNDQITDFCLEYPEPAKGSRRQDLEPCYIRNGAIYSMTRDTLLGLKSRHGPDSRPFEMPDERSINIDGWMDLKIVDLMIRDGQCENLPKKIVKSQIEKFDLISSPKLLITAPLEFMPELKASIKNEMNCIFAYGATVDQVVDLLKDCDAWLCSPAPTYKIDKKVVENAGKLKIIVTPSTGSNHIDVPFCEARGIQVVSLKGTSIISDVYASSEFTFALMLALVRKLPIASEYAKIGEWRGVESKLRGRELNGLTLGIIGFGRIGSNLAKYANAMNMNILAFDPFKKINEIYVTQKDSYVEVLSSSDVVAVCVHLDSSTKEMVDKNWFKLMKQGAYFINTSRGEVINEDDLLVSLASGKLTGAALDVVQGEQTDYFYDHKLIEYARNHSNLIVTPHIAGLTFESESKTAEYAFNEIKKHFWN
jgi:phosphoglycerate dehydrogenase-like enzyme/CMP-N-acetylneuraminic acid synthetase